MRRSDMVGRIKRIFQITDLWLFQAGGLGFVKRTQKFPSQTVAGIFSITQFDAGRQGDTVDSFDGISQQG